MNARRLIVNADDFGLSDGVNAGIVQAHENGIVTSTSLMVREAAVAEAVAYARKTPHLDLGLHFDLAEWKFKNGNWIALYSRADLDDPVAVEVEMRSQLATFRMLVGRDPTHLDSHQHVHQREPFHSIATRIAREISRPLRHFTPDIRYCGDFYGQDETGTPLPNRLTADALIAIVNALPPGVTELACHPGHSRALATMYEAERSIEVSVLCDPRVRTAIVEAGIELIRFSTLPRNLRQPDLSAPT